MTSYLPHNIAKKIGIEDMNDTDQQAILFELERTIIWQIILYILQKLDTKSRTTFIDLLDSGDVEAVELFLERYIEDNKQIVGEALTQTIQEFIETNATLRQ